MLRRTSCIATGTGLAQALITSRKPAMTKTSGLACLSIVLYFPKCPRIGTLMNSVKLSRDASNALANKIRPVPISAARPCLNASSTAC